MNRKLHLAIIGTDGSGKSTTANVLSEKINNESNLTSSVVWCGAESILMRPLRFILKILASQLFSKYLKKTRPNDFKSSVSNKRRMVDRFRLFESLYVKLVLLDYYLQYLWKGYSLKATDVCILDRYYFDVAVNLAVTLDWTEDKLILFIQKSFNYYTLPKLRYFIKADPNTSLQRKNDIPDIEYLNIRMKYYSAIAKSYGFCILDGSNNLSDNVNRIFKEILKSQNLFHIHYIHSNNEDIGGADFCLQRLANEIDKKDMFCSSVSLRLQTRIVQDYIEDGIPVLIGNFTRPQLTRGILPILLLPLAIIRSSIYFFRLFRIQNPDVVHVNDLYDFIPALVAKLMKIPVVYHIRMIRTKNLEVSLFRFIINNFSDTSFSVSQAVLDTYFPHDFAHKKSEAVVIHDWPLDQTLFIRNYPRPPEFDSYDKVVLMIGRLDPWKGQDIYLNAVDKIRNDHPTTGFFLIGGIVSGHAKQSFAKSIIEKSKNIGIDYLGEREDIPLLLSHADISVHCSVTPDPFPGVVLESLLSNTTTIGSAAGGVIEMIRPGKDGLLFPPGSSNELANCLDLLLNNNSLRNSLAISGYQYIASKTNKERILSKVIGHYEKLIEQHYTASGFRKT